MRRRRGRLASGGLALSMALAACVWGGDDDSSPPDALSDRDGLTPTFDSLTTTTAGGPGSSASTATTASSAGTSSTSVTTTGGPSGDRPSATITDPVGDATPADGAPRWADLAGAMLVAEESYLELRVRLGDPAPTSSGSADRTMNMAAFVDVDGDGQIDYELWANLADGGWDGSWFDNRTGAAAFSDDAAMDVVVDGSELVVRFPPDYVGGAEAFRWSLASEYGTYALLGTSDTARDDAPDDDRAVAFPQ